jgi:hypothetical protein
MISGARQPQAIQIFPLADAFTRFCERRGQRVQLRLPQLFARLFIPERSGTTIGTFEAHTD